MKSAFMDQESGKQELLSLLNEKYNGEFQIVKNEKFNKYGLIYSYSCVAAPIENITQEFNAIITSDEKLKDNFQLWLFRDEMIKKGEQLCSKLELVQSYEVIPQMGISEKKWDSQYSLEQFVQESGAYLILEIRLGDEIEEIEYVEKIRDILGNIYNQDIVIEVRIDSKDGSVFWETLTPASNPLSDKEIKEAIETAIDGRW
ncbi:MAG: hypothetical protein RR678_10630 [Lachnospiraceae bacterium]